MFTNSPRIRQIIYGLAIAAQIASFFVALISPDLATAFVSTAGVLAAVAGVTALSNITPPAAQVEIVTDDGTIGVDSGFTRDDTGFNS